MRAREITRVSEGWAEVARDLYRSTDFAKNRKQQSAVKSAQVTFEKNIANLISRAIMSGSIIQRAPQSQQQAQQATPTANNPFPGTTPSAPTAPTGAKGKKMPTANNPFQIKEAGPQTMANAPVSATNSPRVGNPNSFAQSGNSSIAFKPGAVAQTIDQYVDSLVRKYRWQDNPELKSNVERIANEIEQKLSDPTVFKSIATAIQQKNPKAIAKIVQTITADLTAQLFNTMYQWEQVGQSVDQSADKTPEKTKFKNTLEKMSEFLKQAADKPEMLQTADGQKYLQNMELLAQQSKNTNQQ